MSYQVSLYMPELNSIKDISLYIPGVLAKGWLTHSIILYCSKTSDSGPSEIGTVYNRPLDLQGTLFEVPNIYSSYSFNTFMIDL